MTKIGPQNSVSKNWQIAMNDGVVTAKEAKDIIAAAREKGVSKQEIQDASKIITKALALQTTHSMLGAVPLPAGASDKAVQMYEEGEKRRENVFQNANAARDIFNALDPIKPNQKEFKVWLYSFFE